MTMFREIRTSEKMTDTDRKVAEIIRRFDEEAIRLFDLRINEETKKKWDDYHKRRAAALAEFGIVESTFDHDKRI